MRESAIAHGSECLARHLGLDARAVLTGIAGIPAPTTPRVLERVSERGLP